MSEKEDLMAMLDAQEAAMVEEDAKVKDAMEGTIPEIPSCMTDAARDHLASFLPAEEDAPRLYQYLEQAILDIRDMAALKEHQRVPRDIKRGLERLRKAINGLSPYAEYHLHRELHRLDNGAGWLNTSMLRTALEQPYTGFGANPERELLKRHASWIDRYYIRNDSKSLDTRNTLEQLLEFMLQTTGLDWTVDQLADEIRARD